MVEVLKQGRFEPMPVEEQVIEIYAGTQGFLDDIAVENVRTFLEGPARATSSRSTPRCSQAIRDAEGARRARPKRLLRDDIAEFHKAVAPERSRAGDRGGRPDVATLQDIRRRIASTQNTRKITKAMELVSAAKLRRAQARMEALRPYAGAMVEMMRDLATFADEKSSFALLREHDTAKAEPCSSSPATAAWPARSTPTCCAPALPPTASSREGLDRKLLVVGKKGIGTLRFRGLHASSSRGRARATGRPTPTPKPSPTT